MKADEERALLQRHYPDVMSAGSLAAVVGRELSDQGSRLDISRHFFGAQSSSFASCFVAERGVQLYMALLERNFSIGVWADRIEVAHGLTPDVAVLARFIRRWLEYRQSATALCEEFPFIELTDNGVSYERGTYLEDTWRRFVERDRSRPASEEAFHWSDLQAVIDVAARHPVLQRYVPYTSLWRFSVASEAGPPNTSVPVIYPLGGSRYSLAPYWGGEARAEGDAATVVEALASYLRDNSVPPSRFAP